MPSPWVTRALRNELTAQSYDRFRPVEPAEEVNDPPPVVTFTGPYDEWDAEFECDHSEPRKCQRLGHARHEPVR